MKTERIDLRVRPDQKVYYLEMSEKLGLDLSEMLRRAADYYIQTMLQNTSGKKSV